MNAPLPQAVVDEMARREYRVYHLLWREIRRYWHQYPRDVQDKIRELGWEPPRPAADENEAPILDNDSGEDFFYTNKQLIRRVNRILTRVGDPDYPQIEGWVSIPGPDDADYPVPPPWFDPGSHPIVNRYIARIKTDVVWEKHLLGWEKTFTDPMFLRSVSLGKFGALVDYYLVNPFRRRWAAAPGAMRPAIGPEEAAGIDPVWDDPRYDFLSDHYSMLVNPIFWRFAGWIDDRLEEWKYANGVFGDAFWKATWAGNLPEESPASTRTASAAAGASSSAERTGDLAAMEELARTIGKTGLASASDVGDIDLGAPANAHGEHRRAVQGVAS